MTSVALEELSKEKMITLMMSQRCHWSYLSHKYKFTTENLVTNWGVESKRCRKGWTPTGAEIRVQWTPYLHWPHLRGRYRCISLRAVDRSPQNPFSYWYSSRSALSGSAAESQELLPEWEDYWVGPSHCQGFNIITLFHCVAPMGKMWVHVCVCMLCVWRKKEGWEVIESRQILTAGFKTRASTEKELLYGSVFPSGSEL